MKTVPLPIVLAAVGLLLVGTYPRCASAIPHADAPQTDQSRNTLLQTGTLLRIAMKQTVSSGRNKVGDKFAFSVVDDVKIGDRVAIPAGTPGTGVVVACAPAHGGRVDGVLHIQLDPIKVADGTTIEVAITRESIVADENEHNGAAGSLAMVADVTVPGFFLIDILRKGDDVTLAAGAPFHVAVTQDAFFPPPDSP
jgi:hypothetical protein